MSKFNHLNSKIFVALGVIVFLVILLSSSSVQMEIFAADPGAEKLFLIAPMTMIKIKRYVVIVQITL